MGFLDSLVKGGKEETEVPQSNAPFKVQISFAPLRLSAMKDNKVHMIVKVSNLTNDTQLVSLDAQLPQNRLIGFDATCIHKNIEKKVGEVPVGGTSEISIPIWGNNQTKEGNYDIQISIYSHYLDYKKVLNSMRKNMTLRVV